jgi:hypothetical protein
MSTPTTKAIQHLWERYSETARQLQASGYSDIKITVMLARKAERDGLAAKGTVMP